MTFIEKIFGGAALSKKQAAVLSLLGILGMALIMLSALFEGGGGAGKAVAEERQSLDSYAEKTEKKLAALLNCIGGIDNAHVMVTLENGSEYRYATDEKQSGDSVFTYADGSGQPYKVQEKSDMQQSYILVDSNNGKTPLVLTELSPRIKGVVVVCGGADKPVVRQKVIEAVTTALGISSLQVCVIESD